MIVTKLNLTCFMFFFKIKRFVLNKTLIDTNYYIQMFNPVFEH